MRETNHPFDSMEQFFEQMRREMLGNWGPTPALETQHVAGGWDAGISVEETDDGFVVLADLPGFDREELSVRLYEGRLHLDGEHEVGDGVGYRSRQVSEQITLPAHVDPEDVTASYNNGVLEVRCVVDSADSGAGTDIEIA